ncbi:MAG: hypothetical protein ABIY51_02360 [Ferruginibacter sp.]
MNIKLLISALTILLASASNGQSLKIDTFKTTIADTGSLIRWQCHAGPSITSKDTYPLIIINGRKFKNSLLQNIFFDLDTTTISALQVLNPKNDSVKLYGKAGRNGVIIITTKKSFEWISIREILKQKSNAISSPHDKTLIKIGNALFEPGEELFFQKNLIKNVSVKNNKSQYYINRQFNSVVTINMTKKSGT